MIFVAALTAALANSPPPATTSLWLDAPVVLDEGIAPTLVDRIGEALRSALGEQSRDLTYGRDAVLQERAGGSTHECRLENAHELIRKGEDAYFALDFATAAASLAEGAGILTACLASLDEEEMTRLLYKARLFEGVSWLESGQREAAKMAFLKLLVLRVDFQPDPAILPPHARDVFAEAVREVHAADFATLEVRSEPPGAEVWLDGVRRGITPTTVAGLPPGVHQIRLRLPGYDDANEEVGVRPGQMVIHEAQLTPTEIVLAYSRIRAAARGGQSLAVVQGELERLALTMQRTIILVGVARYAGGLIVTARRWAPSTPAIEQAAVVSLVDTGNIEERAMAVASHLLAASWPAVQLPSESPRLAIDFSRALLGIGPDWGREPVEISPPLLERWWFWAAVGVVAGSTAASALLLTSPDGKPRSRSERAEFQLVFP